MKPLSGLKIVSVEQFGAGPYGTMLLADLGAEVIKVENAAIGGDPARKTGPYFLGDNDSEYFQVFNLNKKSVSLDLRSEEGRAALRELAMTADALMNNLRGDLPAKMGLDYAALGKHKPSIVCVHLSAYGRDNSRTSWPGYDYLMQAEFGPDASHGGTGRTAVAHRCPFHGRSDHRTHRCAWSSGGSDSGPHDGKGMRCGHLSPRRCGPSAGICSNLVSQ